LPGLRGPVDLAAWSDVRQRDGSDADGRERRAPDHCRDPDSR
jgi:hypothetical protein